MTFYKKVVRGFHLKNQLYFSGEVRFITDFVCMFFWLVIVSPLSAIIAITLCGGPELYLALIITLASVVNFSFNIFLSKDSEVYIDIKTLDKNFVGKEISESNYIVWIVITVSVLLTLLVFYWL